MTTFEATENRLVHTARSKLSGASEFATVAVGAFKKSDARLLERATSDIASNERLAGPMTEHAQARLVTVVLDRSFGADPNAKVGEAYWLIDSPVNRALAERLRHTDERDPNSAVFLATDDEPLGETAERVFFNVIEHHPEWRQIEFVGVPLLAELRSVLADEGAEATASGTGFIATKIATT